MASTSPTAIGTYRSITRRPPRSLAGSRKAGTLPRITSSRGGKAGAKNTAAGSRRKSFSSTTVSLRSAGTGIDLLAEGVVGEGDEGVIEAGPLHTQLGRDA